MTFGNLCSQNATTSRAWSRTDEASGCWKIVWDIADNLTFYIMEDHLVPGADPVVKRPSLLQPLSPIVDLIGMARNLHSHRSSRTEQNSSGQGQGLDDPNDHPELFGVPGPPWNSLHPCTTGPIQWGQGVAEGHGKAR